MSDRDNLRSCSTFDRGLQMIDQQNPDDASIDAQLQVTNLHPMCWIDCCGLPLSTLAPYSSSNYHDF